MLLISADVEWQLLYALPNEAYPVRLTFGTGPHDAPFEFAPTMLLPEWHPIPVTGPHVRRDSFHNVISGLATGTYRVGLAGLADPPAGTAAELTVHRIRLTILVVSQ